MKILIFSQYAIFKKGSLEFRYNANSCKIANFGIYSLKKFRIYSPQFTFSNCSQSLSFGFETLTRTPRVFLKPGQCFFPTPPGIRSGLTPHQLHDLQHSAPPAWGFPIGAFLVEIFWTKE